MNATLTERNTMKLPKRFILCAFNSENIQAEATLLSRLGLVAIPVMGRYKGQDEASWLVSLYDDADLSKLIPYLIKAKQESYLFVGIDRRSTLVYLNDASIVDLGHFTSVCPIVAMAQDAHTFEPETNTYFVCIK